MFNRWIVFAIDLVLCIAAYVGAVYIRSKVDPFHSIPNVAGWAFLYLVLNAFSFYFFKSYRGLIRHSNLQELWRVFVALFVLVGGHGCGHSISYVFGAEPDDLRLVAHAQRSAHRRVPVLLLNELFGQEKQEYLGLWHWRS